jgi:hypothetical protein
MAYGYMLTNVVSSHKWFLHLLSQSSCQSSSDYGYKRN